MSSPATANCNVMPPLHQTVDSLWHCLCPSFRSTPTAFTRLSRPSLAHRPHTRQVRTPRPRRLHATIAATKEEEGDVDGHQHDAANTAVRQTVAVEEGHTKHHTRPSGDVASPVSSSQQQHRQSSAQDAALVEKGPRHAFRVLRSAAENGSHRDAWEAATALVTKLGQRPNAQHYALLIEANCDVRAGSLEEVQALLREMDGQGIEPDQDVFEALLKVLAIHPSYTLRAAVLERMREHWIELKPEGHAHVVCGLLRERQLEQALNRLEDMHRAGLRQPAWLVDLVIHVLADVGEFDALLPYLRARSEDRVRRLSHVLVSNVLNRAAKHLHHPVVRFLWSLYAAHGLLNPSTGLCTAVLDTAARAGDPLLATDVFRVLGNRSSPLAAHHYEALIEAHMAVGVTATEQQQQQQQQPDLYRAFSIVCLMNQSTAAAVSATDRTTRPVFQYLTAHPDRTEEAWDLILLLHKHGRTVPVELANAVLDAAVQAGELGWALDRYRMLATFGCDFVGADRLATPTVVTFNILLRGCYKAGRKDHAMFVAAEMVALGVAPDALTYDRLILACLLSGPSPGSEGRRRAAAGEDEEEDEDEGEDEDEDYDNDGGDLMTSGERENRRQQTDLDDAFRYLGEMQSRGWWPRRGTLSVLGRKAARREDPRLLELVRWIENNGGDPGPLRVAVREYERSKAADTFRMYDQDQI